jgi:hypothetical protein
MNSKKTILIVAALIVIAVIVYVVYQRDRGLQVDYSPATQESDTSSAITQDLEGVDLGDIDKEFQDIDKELNSL